MQFINKNIRDVTNLNQWQNTTTVISWFKQIPNKSRSKFLQLDIVDFYPSITEKLLVDAINFAKTSSCIEDDNIEIIMHCRRALLFEGTNVWTKKRNPAFDVTMGSFDGAEICELVGLYLLHQMRENFLILTLGSTEMMGLASPRVLVAHSLKELRSVLLPSLRIMI